MDVANQAGAVVPGTPWWRRGEIGLLALLVIVKSIFVLSLSDVFFYGEELEKGTAAKAMIDGLDVPHHQLAYHYYEGGGFVASHLKALAFLLVGQNLLAHKLVALAFDAAILLAGFRLTRRLFGERAGLFFGLLFVFGPESYQKLGLISLGIHFEALLFLFAILALGANLAFGPPSASRPGRRRWTWFALGLTTGFGLYFSYQVALVALWVALFLLVRRPREVLGVPGLLGLIGTALGALPLLGMYSLVGDAIFDIHGTAIAGSDGGPTNSELFRSFLASVFLEGGFGQQVAAWVWTACTLAAAGLLYLSPEVPQGGASSEAVPRRMAAVYLGGYMLLFFVVYLSSGFVQGEVYHYFLLLRLVPLWAVGAVLIAGASSFLLREGSAPTRFTTLVAGSLLLALGLRASAGVVGTGRPLELGANWRVLTGHKGYRYDQYFAKVLGHFGTTPRETLELIEGFEEDAPALLRADLVTNLFRESGADLSAAYLATRSTISAYGQERLGHYELGLGPLLLIGHGWNRGAALKQVAASREPGRSALLEALGRFGGGSHPLPRPIAREIARGRDLEGGEPFLRGLGRWIYGAYRLDPEGVESLLADYPAAVAAPIREGFESEREWSYLP